MKWIKKTYLQCIPVVFTVFFFFLWGGGRGRGALLRNHCYSFHRTKWRLVSSIWQGPGPIATRMPFFSPKLKSAATFSAPAQEGNLLFLSGRSTSPTNRAICAGLQGTSGFRLVPVTTYTTGARTHFFTLQSLVDVSFPPLHPSCKC